MKFLYLILFMFIITKSYSQIEIPNTPYINYKYYSVYYDEVNKCAIWSAYSFTLSDTTKSVDRYKKYIRDKDVKIQATDKDYYKSGYDKGHLSPAGNFKFNLIASKEINFFTNITPQYPSFNRGIWKRLENQVRRWVLEYDTLYIVSGPLFNGELTTIGDGIIVPNYYYKLIIAKKDTNYYSIAFLIPNEKSNISIFDFQVTINYIEVITGIDFYYKLEDSIEELLESKNTISYTY